MIKNSNSETLTSIITGYFPLEKASLNRILAEFRIRSLKKGEFFSVIGESDTNEYFVLSGIVHSSVINEDGTVISTDFYQDKSIITPHFSRTIAGKSVLNLEALVNVTLAEIPVKVLDSLRNSFEDIRGFGGKVVEQELFKSLSNGISFRSLNAKNRLLLFRKNHPNLENLISHVLIASYLGITPVSFSRLRRELAGK